MTEDAKSLAERRLLEMTAKALDVIDQSLTSAKVARGQQTRSADAWRVIDNVLRLATEQEVDAKPIAKVDPAEAVAEIRRRAAVAGAKH